MRGIFELVNLALDSAERAGFVLAFAGLVRNAEFLSNTETAACHSSVIIRGIVGSVVGSRN